MISTLLLIVIYVAFISLGLPDSVLGAAWPRMHISLDVPMSFAGILSMTCSFGTIISALSFSFISRKFKTITITSVSTLLTAIALFCYGFIDKFYMLIPVTLCLGLGAGSIDSALNNYVALHYKARQMSFLHACWGIGTTVSPFILAYAFSNNLSWHFGYLAIASMQSLICLLLFISTPLWEKNNSNQNTIAEEDIANMGYKEAIKKKGAIFSLLGFFCYCSMENSAMLWASAYSVDKGLDAAAAASVAGLLFWGITIGRIITGVVADRLGDKKLIRIGILMIIMAVALILLLPTSLLGIALFLLGAGFAPIYPSMIHQTPFLFGRKASATLIGLQMATAYVGSTFMPAIFGLVSSSLGVSILPIYISIFLCILILATELKRRKSYK